MIIIAWHQRVSSNVLFDEDVVRSVLSIFITAAILNFLRGTLSHSMCVCVHVYLLSLLLYNFLSGVPYFVKWQYNHLR